MRVSGNEKKPRNADTEITSFRLPNAGQFKGTGGPEDSVKIDSENRPGDQDALNLQDMKKRGIAH